MASQWPAATSCLESLQHCTTQFSFNFQKRGDLVALTELSCWCSQGNWAGWKQPVAGKCHSLPLTQLLSSLLLSHFLIFTLLMPPPRHLVATSGCVVVPAPPLVSTFPSQVEAAAHSTQPVHARPLSPPAPDCRAARAVHTLQGAPP